MTLHTFYVIITGQKRSQQTRIVPRLKETFGDETIYRIKIRFFLIYFFLLCRKTVWSKSIQTIELITDITVLESAIIKQKNGEIFQKCV